VLGDGCAEPARQQFEQGQQARTSIPARAMFRAIAKPIVPPTPSTATASAVRADLSADVPPCAI